METITLVFFGLMALTGFIMGLLAGKSIERWFWLDWMKGLKSETCEEQCRRQFEEKTAEAERDWGKPAVRPK